MKDKIKIGLCWVLAHGPISERELYWVARGLEKEGYLRRDVIGKIGVWGLTKKGKELAEKKWEMKYAEEDNLKL